MKNNNSNHKNGFYDYYEDKININSNEENELKIIPSPTIAELKKDIYSLIEQLQKFNYWALLETVFDLNNKIINKDKRSFNLKEIEEIDNFLELRNIFESLDILWKMLIMRNQDWIVIIKNNILLSEKPFQWNIMAFDLLMNFNIQLAQILYIPILQYEDSLKRKIYVSMMVNNYFFDDISNFKISKSIKKEYLKIEADMNKTPMIFNHITFNATIEWLRKIKDQQILENTLRYILEDSKFEAEIINNNIFTLKNKVIKNLQNLNKLRNKIMHYDFLIPTKEKNVLMEAIKSWKYLTQNWSEYEKTFSGQYMYEQIIKMIKLSFPLYNSPLPNDLYRIIVREYMKKYIIDFEIN